MRHTFINNNKSKKSGCAGVCNAYARTYAHMRTHKPRCPRAASSLRSDNCRQLVTSLHGGRQVDDCRHPCHVSNCVSRLKKVRKSFVDSDFFRNFAAMNDQIYVITAINKLTKQRVEISRPMSEDEAHERLAREMQSRRRQRYQPYSRLRVERRLPVQLLLNFSDYDTK